MKINIYYGGRGFIDDPSLYVIHKMQTVLEELNVQVETYMLQEQKNVLTSLVFFQKTIRQYLRMIC